MTGSTTSDDARRHAPEAAPEMRLDLRGYRCPAPVLRLEAALRKAPADTSVVAIADDPVAAIDIPHFCREAGRPVRRLPDERGAAVFLVGPKPA